MAHKQLERTRARTRQLGPIERDILDELTLGDVLYSFLLSARSTRRFYKLARERAAHRYRRRLAVERLKQQGYIREHNDRLSITVRGQNALESAAEKIHKLLKTKKWDGRWRIVAFDIPEKHGVLRDKVRRVLKQAGFLKLQHSIWLFPHDCEELVQLIQKESRLSQYILYGILERIEGADRFVKLFRL